MQKTKSPNKITHKELSKELIDMFDTDQKLLNERLAYELKKDTKNVKLVDSKFKELNQKHIQRMKGIIDKYGFPTISMVGEMGSQAAWLLVQHADSNPKFQQKVLDLMIEASKVGEASKSNTAYLIDRVRVNTGRPQLYGTQTEKKGGKLVPKPIENEKEVDKRRKQVGLKPIADYIKRVNEIYADKFR